MDEHTPETASTPGTLKRPPTKALPTDRLILSKQFDVLRAYGSMTDPARDEPVSKEDVAGSTGLSPSTVALSNRFFEEIGLLRKIGRGHAATPTTMAFAAELDRGVPLKRAVQELSNPVGDSWLYEAGGDGLVNQNHYEGAAGIAKAAEANGDYFPRAEIAFEFLQHVFDMLENGQDDTQSKSGTEPKESVEPEGKKMEEASQDVGRINFTIDLRPMAGWTSDKNQRYIESVARLLELKSQLDKMMVSEN